jgi:hypothetical protein
MTVESLKVFFDWGAVIPLFLTFAFGAGVLITGNIISARQAEKLKQFDKNLTGAKLELGKQQERAANTERSEADAKKTAEGFHLDIASANWRAAEAEARAADANRIPEEEHLARVRIEERSAGWKLDAAAHARIINQVKPYEKTPFDLAANPVGVASMETIDGVLSACGWTRQLPKRTIL